MIAQKRWGFGLGTIFSLIVIYFIFLYARDKGWTFLVFLSKWYLIIVVGLIALVLMIILFVFLFALLLFLIGVIKLNIFGRKYKKQNEFKEYIDVEYKVK